MTERLDLEHAFHGQETKHYHIDSREQLKQNSAQLFKFQYKALNPSFMHRFEHADAQLLIMPHYEGRDNRFNPLLADIYETEYPEAEKPMFRVHCLQYDIATMNLISRGAVHNFQPGLSRQYLDLDEKAITRRVSGQPEDGEQKFPCSFTVPEAHTVEKRRLQEGMCYPMRLVTAAITPRRVVSKPVDAEALHQGLQYYLNLSDDDMEFSQQLTAAIDSVQTGPQPDRTSR